ncbi:MAG: DUF4349 domain-containing protein [Bacteroidota bacterium]
MRLFLFCALALALVACAEEGAYAPESADVASLDVAPDDIVEAEASSGVPVRTVQDTTGRRAPILLRTADLSFRVDDYPEAAAAVPRIVRRFDAYIAGEQEDRSSYRVSNRFEIRVAATEFDSLLAALTPLASEVEARTISVSDVTEEYVDMEARLRARRAVEAQYTALLSRAGSIEDVLNVQTRLSQVREEIERAEGRLRYLRDRAALSTITLTLFEASPTGITAGPSFFSRLGDAFGGGWEVLLGFVVAVVAVWPLWLLLVVGALGLRAWRRRNPGAFRLGTKTRRPLHPDAEPKGER